MLQNAKALVVVLALALVVFHLARPLCIRYMREETFARRRNVWLGLTVLGFLSPSFALYAALATPLLLWASWRDDNPVTLYVLLAFVIPDVRLYVSLPGINQLFDLTQYRLLALTVLVPALLRPADGSRTVPVAGRATPSAWRIEHTALALLVLLQAAVLVPHETPTTTLRRLFLGTIDTVLVVYAIARLRREEQLSDVLCGFWLACVLMVPMALFEAARTWLLYTGIADAWGDPNLFAWLFRGDRLRVQVAAGHSINFGYHLALAFCMYLFLRARGTTRAIDILVFGVLPFAVLLTWSRAAWMVLVLVGIAYAALRPRGLGRVMRVVVVGAFGVALLSLTPFGAPVLDQLPFIGTASQDTVAYRQELAATSWRLIKLHPWLGDPFVLTQMEHLRQGQGIIDVVNGYLRITLDNGVAGLALMMVALGAPTLRSARAYLASRTDDERNGLPGACLLACMLATFVYIAANNYGAPTWVLCGLIGCHAALARSTPASASTSRAAEAYTPRGRGAVA